VIPIYEPLITKKTLKYAHQALDSTWISNLGEFKEKTTDSLTSLLGTKNCILVNNGTSATHLVYKALKIKKPKLKKIIVPNNVYVAAWNSMLFDNDGTKLIPVATDLDTWNVDFQYLQQELKKHDPEDTAILVVHNVGGIVDVPKVKNILPDFEIIEDNCEGLFGKYNNKFSGTHCLASSVSFYGNKTITCGEGGAVFFNECELFDQLDKIHSQGQTKTRYVHDVIGYNYRMTNVQAAILYGQLQNVECILKKKKNIFNLYKKLLSKCENISFQASGQECVNANWIFSIRIHNNESYSNAQSFFSKNGIETRNMFHPMSVHEHLKKYSNPEIEKNDFILSREVVMFPSSPLLRNEQVKYICDKIIEYANDRRGI
jgi:perosamine synthetase